MLPLHSRRTLLVLIGRKALRQLDLLVRIEKSSAIERLPMVIVNFLLQKPLGFGKTFVLHIARCPALCRQHQQQSPQQPHDPFHDDTLEKCPRMA